MKLELQIPMRINVRDYHEFYALGRYLKKLNDKLRVKEVGFISGQYVGIVYEVGTQNEPEYRFMAEQIEQETRRR